MLEDVGEQCIGGWGRIRTFVRSRGQIYSLLPLTTRPPIRNTLYSLSGRWPRLILQARACEATHPLLRAPMNLF